MNLPTPLKKHFGYSAFRPLQEEIVRDALAGRDVFALMSTGAGSRFAFSCPPFCAPADLVAEAVSGSACQSSRRRLSNPE